MEAPRARSLGMCPEMDREREIELSQLLGHIAELVPEIKHGSNTKHRITMRVSLLYSRALQVPTRVQREGPHDRGNPGSSVHQASPQQIVSTSSLKD